MYLTMDPFLIQKPATGTANRFKSNDILIFKHLSSQVVKPSTLPPPCTECMLLQIGEGDS